MKPMSPHSFNHCNLNFLKVKFLTCCKFFYLLLFHVNLSAQAPDWAWATQIHGNSNDAIQFTDADKNGNILLVGQFYSPALQIGDTLLVSNSTPQARGGYVAIIDSLGETLWAKQMFEESDYASTLEISDAIFDEFGNIILAGTSYGENMVLDGLYLEGLEEGYFSFVLKLSPTGEVLFSHIFEKGAVPISLVNDKHSGYYLTAHKYHYCEEVNFGDVQLTGNSGNNGTFIAHFNKDNIVDWAKLFIGYGDELFGVETNNGDLIFHGEFLYDTYKVDTFQLISSGPHGERYIGKCDILGKIDWVQIITPQYESIMDVIALSQGIMVVGGLNEDFAVFGNDTVFQQEVYNPEFIAKINLDGEFTSAVNASSMFPAYSIIQYGPDNLFYISGQIYNSFWTGMDTIFNEEDTGPDLAVLVYDTTQLLKSQFVIPLNGENDIPQIQWDMFGNMLLIGAFSEDTLIFNTDTLINLQLSEQTDHFLARANSCSTTLFSINVNGVFLSAEDGIAWQWYLNELPIEGANNQHYTALQNGTYRVSAKQENGCTLWSESIILPEQSINDEFSFVVYPNPANNQINIYIPYAYDSAEIYNALGELVYVFKGSGQTNLTYENDLKGMYLMVVTANGKTISHQFIIL